MTHTSDLIPRVSVVVCTYNRAELLRLCLQSLARQTAGKDRFEVIVVDNNSTDDTQTVAREFAGAFSRFDVVTEKNQGLSFARNRGWDESKGEYVAFLDDDAQATPRWVETLAEIAELERPDILGGPIHPYYTTAKPPWFKDEYEIRLHQTETGWMDQGWVSGSNFAVYRDLRREIGGFDPAYGMTGESLAYGEEVELLKRARDKKKRVYYSLDLGVLHHVPAHKMDVLSAVNASFRRGFTTHDLWAKDAPFGLSARELKTSLKQLFDALDTAHKPGAYDTAKYPFKENYLFENCRAPAERLGAIVGRAQKSGVAGLFSLSLLRSRLAATIRAALVHIRGA